MRLNEHDNTAKDYNAARSLRSHASPMEKKLWVALRELAAQRDLKFRRQQVIHSFIADFACMAARLLVELDGLSHEGRVDYDKAREDFLQQQGYTIMRFTNQEILENTEGVVLTIIDHAETLIGQTNDGTRTDAPLPTLPARGRA